MRNHGRPQVDGRTSWESSHRQMDGTLFTVGTHLEVVEFQCGWAQGKHLILQSHCVLLCVWLAGSYVGKHLAFGVLDCLVLPPAFGLQLFIDHVVEFAMGLGQPTLEFALLASRVTFKSKTEC